MSAVRTKDTFTHLPTPFTLRALCPSLLPLCARYEEVSRMYRMELNRTEMTEQKKKKEMEMRKYDKMRKECEKFHEDFRFAVIDHQASGLAGKPSKLNKMKVIVIGPLAAVY